MTLAIFDLDNTLIAGDSDHLWGEFLCAQGLVDRDHFKAHNDAFYKAYGEGTLDIGAYLRFVLTPLVGKSLAEVNAWHKIFMADWIEPIILKKAQELIDSHRQRGHTPIIVTATNTVVTAPIAHRFGIDWLLGCEVEIVNNRYTGLPTGVPSFQEGKVTRLREWAEQQQQTLAGAWFYSDSHNDLPLLEIVDNPVAVDPDSRLAARARERSWPILSLRSD